MKILKIFLAASLLSSCSFVEKILPSKAATPIDYLERGVKMDVKKFFNGDVEAFAITQNQEGKITGTQTVKINGKWDENKGVVTYNFSFDDGKKDSRTWLITANQDGTLDSVGHDIVSPGKGKQVGNALQMIYSLLLPSEGGKKETKFEERVYLVDEKSAIMIVNFKRAGGESGKSIVSLKKLSKVESKSDSKSDSKPDSKSDSKSDQ